MDLGETEKMLSVHVGSSSRDMINYMYDMGGLAIVSIVICVY